MQAKKRKNGSKKYAGFSPLHFLLSLLYSTASAAVSPKAYSKNIDAASIIYNNIA